MAASLSKFDISWTQFQLPILLNAQFSYLSIDTLKHRSRMDKEIHRVISIIYSDNMRFMIRLWTFATSQNSIDNSGTTCCAICCWLFSSFKRQTWISQLSSRQWLTRFISNVDCLVAGEMLCERKIAAKIPFEMFGCDAFIWRTNRSELAFKYSQVAIFDHRFIRHKRA